MILSKLIRICEQRVQNLRGGILSQQHDEARYCCAANLGALTDVTIAFKLRISGELDDKRSINATAEHFPFSITALIAALGEVEYMSLEGCEKRHNCRGNYEAFVVEVEKAHRWMPSLPEELRAQLKNQKAK
jgi:hypothetical protein